MTPGICKYYGTHGSERGILHTVCDKGVDIRALVGGPDYGWLRRMPCTEGLASQALPPPIEPVIPCALRVYPTAAEVEESIKELNRRVDCLLRGVCPKCGADMEREGNRAWCPVCPDMSLRQCGRR